MNFLRQKLRNVRNLLAAPSSIISRAVSTATPPLLREPSASPRQLNHPFSATARQSPDPSTMYDISPPVNWGIRVAHMNKAYIIERSGKYLKTLTPGIHFLIPFVDRIAYEHCLLQKSIPIPVQSAITKDKIKILIDGFLHVKIVDPKLASYGVKNPLYAASQLAQSTLGSEIGKITLQNALEGRKALGEKIMISVNEAGKKWGVKCFHSAIRDISFPPELSTAMMKKAVAMEMQAIAEIQWKTFILESEVIKGEAEIEAEIARQRASMKEINVILPFLEETQSVHAANLRTIEKYLDS